jgi:hypothetical protein
MKKMLLILSASLAVVLMLGSVLKAGEIFPQIILYDGTGNTMLTSTYESHLNPQLADNGHAVWVARHSGVNTFSERLMLFDGSSIMPLSESAHTPQINNAGQVVWGEGVADNREIFFYDGTTVIQLSDNDHFDDDARINDSGAVAWRGNGVWLYDGANTIQITADAGFNVQLNNNGEVVWEAGDGTRNEIFLYDGSGITQITDNDLKDHDPQINDSGLVVWWGQTHADSDYEIFRYDDGEITQITDNDYTDWRPRINNSGQAVWVGILELHGDLEIFYYDGSGITQVTENEGWDHHPQINDNGLAVWEGQGDVFLFDGTETVQLSMSGLHDEWPQINNADHVIWSGYRHLPERPWGAASIMNPDYEHALRLPNYLAFFVVPAGVVLLLRRSRRRS